MSESAEKPNEIPSPGGGKINKPMASAAVFLIGTTITLLGAFIGGAIIAYSKHVENVEKKQKAVEEKLVRDRAEATQAALRTQLDNALAEGEAREREHTRQWSQAIDVIAAASNVKAEYERRMEMLKTASKTEIQNLAKRPPTDNLDAKIAEAFAGAPVEIASKLEEVKRTEARENALLSIALARNAEVRPKIVELVDAVSDAIQRVSEKGHLQISSVSREPIPDRLSYTMRELAKGTGKPGILQVNLVGGNGVSVNIAYGRVKTPESVSQGVRESKIDDELPRILVHSNATLPVSGEIRFEAFRFIGDESYTIKPSTGALSLAPRKEPYSDIEAMKDAVVQLLLKIRVERAIGSPAK